MDYNRIILELFDRVKGLEERVGSLEAQVAELETCRARWELEDGVKCVLPKISKISEKYRGLADYLLQVTEQSVTLTYAEIEAILGFPLPQSAVEHKRSYWANTVTHSYASSWLGVGFKTKTDASDHLLVTFVRQSRQ